MTVESTLHRLTRGLAQHYTVTRELGAGGMATVYLAHDIKHDRDVAIKVLHPDLGAALGGERFLTEIRTTARLQHPHILPLLDSGEAEGLLYYVMPLVTGETLRARLTREKQLPIDDALLIAREVADALHYAHAQNVIHRDIKPENILLQGGHALVADFGIALAVQSAGGSRMTQTGLSLGTPSYMSPEQAMGERTIDARSDIYALGAVTYEMLVGDAPFTGSTVQAIVAKVLTERPTALTAIRDTVNPSVEHAVLKALAKLPADRFATAAEFAAALDSRFEPRRTAHSVQLDEHSNKWRAIALVAGGTAVACALFGVWAMTQRATNADVDARVEFAFRPSSTTTERPIVAISPDGRRVIQPVKDSAGVSHLIARELGSTAVIRLPGSDGATEVAISPAGDWIAMLVEGKIRKMPIAGGPSTVVADSATSGPAWTADGSILYSRTYLGLWRSPANGAAPEEITTLDSARREFQHWYPQELPGAKAVIFNSYSTPLARSRIEAVEYATGKRTVLVDGAHFARYVPSGHLLFIRDNAIFAVAFDARNLRVIGTAVPVVEDVAAQFTDGTAGFAVSENGTLVFLKYSEFTTQRRLLWVDRSGTEEAILPNTGLWAEPRLSPDGRWIAFTSMDPRWQIMLFDRNRKVLTQLTRSEGVSFDAVWMPDSKSVIHTFETPVYDLMRTPIDGSAADTLLVNGKDKMAQSVSPDGRTLAYTDITEVERLTLMPVSGGPSKSFDARPSAQITAHISPDGRWMTYDEMGQDRRYDVYVRAMDGKGGRQQVSKDGGDQPRWTRGGREIVYRKGDAMLAVSFNPATADVGVPLQLFTRKAAGRLGGSRTYGYDVTPDGSRFLMIVPVQQEGAQPTVVVINWLEELKRKVPQK